MTDVTSGHEPDSTAESTGEIAEEAGAEGTRERILTEAVQMFQRHGYHRTSLRLLADRLGVTKAAILYHFPAKDRIMLALMEPFVAAIEDAVEQAAALPFPQCRWALLDGMLDAYLRHQPLLLMARTDASIFTQEETYQRFMRLPGRVIEVIVGPDAPLEDKVWAVQLMGTLGDSVVFFADVSKEELRAAIVRGTMRLLVDGPPSQLPPRSIGVDVSRPKFNAFLDVAHPPHPTGKDTPGSGRRVGRPRVLSGEGITRAKEMYATGEHSAEEIAAELGVSRATVYRYLN